MAFSNPDDSSYSTSSQKMPWSTIINEPTSTPPSPISAMSDESEVTSKRGSAKRIRIPIACTTCRHKKIKCDGQTPCSHCEKVKAGCVYPPATKPVSHEYVEELESRLESIRSCMYRQTSAEDLGRPFGVDMASPPQRHRPTSGSGAPGTDEMFSTDETIKALNYLMGNLKVNRDGTARFLSTYGPPNETSYTEMRNYQPNTAPPGPSKILDLNNLDWASVGSPPQYAFPTNLLPREVIGALIDIFFREAHPYLPLLHEPSFRTLFQDGEYRIPPFLLMAICAVASRHANGEEQQRMVEAGCPVNNHTLFDHARALIDTFTDIPRVSTIQGLLLLTYYQIKEERTRYYFRTKTYLSMAVGMARDMGLSRDILKSMDEIDTASGDNSTDAANYDQRSESTTAGLRSKSSSTSLSRRKLAAIQHERRLAWLGCCFLDGLFNSQYGLEYCVPRINFDIRRLIREAGTITDTAQGATLIFWYLHLDLVLLYRRICEMYRFQEYQQTIKGAATVNDLQGTEMLSIKNALENWIATVPTHLIYGGPAATMRPQSNPINPSEPHFCHPWYLHRFYYSLVLLFYRPVIASKDHRGDPSDPSSAISKCLHAATQLTEIGELILHYCPWPLSGCGIFAYHMLQATEVHVFGLITQSQGSQNLYSRTTGLLHKFFTGMNMPDSVKDIARLNQNVNDYLSGALMHIPGESSPISGQLALPISAPLHTSDLREPLEGATFPFSAPIVTSGHSFPVGHGMEMGYRQSQPLHDYSQQNQEQLSSFLDVNIPMTLYNQPSHHIYHDQHHQQLSQFQQLHQLPQQQQHQHQHHQQHHHQQHYQEQPF
ncbi:hypothetical protein BGX34_009347 [Mortierella sp. NVP85]|nr:hypothetical protein BGX34_009347 [Mortierella sp. NVP85]